MASREELQEQLESLHLVSAEIAALHEMQAIHDQALGYCLDLTGSEYAFTGLLVDGPRLMDVAAIKGFEGVDPAFYAEFHLMGVRSSVVGVVIKERRPKIANDVPHDPHSVGQPPGHPSIRTFLGVPLLVGDRIIGMIGVANKAAGYDPDDERLLSTFANQVAMAIESARLSERQREMIAGLRQLHERLSEAEEHQLLTRERERIAGGLHDRIEQDIFSIGIGIDALLAEGFSESAPAEQLRALRQQAIGTANEVRRVIFALAAPREGAEGFESAVQGLLLDLQQKSGLEAQLVLSGPRPATAGRVEDILLSVIREALTNVERHAKARIVLVSLRYEPSRIDVVVQDDGVGVPHPILRTFPDSYLHFGLRHMQQQIADLGGTFEVADGEDCGTIVRVTVPLPTRP
jgi:signal transduction histidine kinase